MTAKLLLICELGLVLLLRIQSQEIGQECTVRKTGRAGTCTRLYSCNDAIQEFRSRRRLTFCNGRNLKDVVCCPNEEVNNLRRISEKKCAEYSTSVYENVTIIPLLANGTPLHFRNDKCGYTVVPLIVGGTKAGMNEFPHMAIIGFGENEWTCSGTLISEKFVLTAAHCQRHSTQGDARYVRLGLVDRSFSNSDQFDIQKFIVHPSYKPEFQYNDIALIQLSQQVKFSPNMRPACLPKFLDEPGKNVIATGWGTELFLGPHSEHLLKVTLEKFSYDECQEVFKEAFELPGGINYTTQICAGSHTESKDTCQGDSGGPLQIYHHSRYCMYTVIGITSFGSPCGLIGTPGVYTRVAGYVNWIEKIVWPGNSR